MSFEMNVVQWSTIEKCVSLMTEDCCELTNASPKEAGPNIQGVAQIQFLVLMGNAKSRANYFSVP